MCRTLRALSTNLYMYVQRCSGKAARAYIFRARAREREREIVSHRVVKRRDIIFGVVTNRLRASAARFIGISPRYSA